MPSINWSKARNRDRMLRQGIEEHKVDAPALTSFGVESASQLSRN
jgi:hypothetical protein